MDKHKNLHNKKTPEISRVWCNNKLSFTALKLLTDIIIHSITIKSIKMVFITHPPYTISEQCNQVVVKDIMPTRMFLDIYQSLLKESFNHIVYIWHRIKRDKRIRMCTINMINKRSSCAIPISKWIRPPYMRYHTLPGFQLHRGNNFLNHVLSLEKMKYNYIIIRLMFRYLFQWDFPLLKARFATFIFARWMWSEMVKLILTDVGKRLQHMYK